MFQIVLENVNKKRFNILIKYFKVYLYKTVDFVFCFYFGFVVFGGFFGGGGVGWHIFKIISLNVLPVKFETSFSTYLSSCKTSENTL